MFPLHHCHQSQLHAMRDTEFGLPILNRFPGATLHLGPGRPPRPCHIRLQGSAATIGAPAMSWRTAVLKPSLNFTVQAIWITEPATDSGSRDCIYSGSVLWKLPLKPCEFRVVLVARKTICRKRWKTKCLWSDLNQRYLDKPKPRALTTQLSLFPFKITVSSLTNYARRNTIKIASKLLPIQLLSHHSYKHDAVSSGLVSRGIWIVARSQYCLH